MYDLAKDRILAVDDEPDNLEVLKATLEMLYDATVQTALGGDEALASLPTFRPTVIVTDLSMPKIDGYVLLHRIRENAETALLPIIALTAHAMDGDRERILAAGFDGYISKPFDVTSLGDDIIACLEQFQASRVAQQPVGPLSSDASGPKQDEGRNTIGALSGDGLGPKRDEGGNGVGPLSGSVLGPKRGEGGNGVGPLSGDGLGPKRVDGGNGIGPLSSDTSGPKRDEGVNAIGALSGDASGPKRDEGINAIQ